MKYLASKTFSKLGLAVAIASATAAGANDKVRIVGGTDAAANSWPWVVTLQGVQADRTPQQKHFCGGSLINDRWVLTASHCIEGQTNDDAKNIEVRIGGLNLSAASTAGELRKVKRILQHPKYDTNAIDQDIALLELTENSAQSKKVIAINKTDMALVTPGTDLTVIGWGTTSDSGDEGIPAKLQQVSVPLVSNATCNASRTGGQANNEVTDNMLCAGTPAGGKDSCRGDSGGPLMVQQNGDWKQVGVVSWGVECGGSNQYGVYARVENYGNWLQQHQQHLSQDTLLNFGYVGAGVEVKETISVYNNAASAQTVTKFTKSDSITLEKDGCLNQAVDSGKSCTVDVKFKSTTAGEAKAKVTAEATGTLGLMETAVMARILPEKTFSTNIANTTLKYYTASDSKAAWQDGNGLLRSGRLTEAGRSPLQVVVTGPKKVSFEWKASHTLKDDRVSVLTNGSRAEFDNPTTSWQEKTVDIPAGQHRLTWVMDMSEENTSEGRHLQLRNLKVGDASSGGTTDDGSTGGSNPAPSTPAPSTPAPKTKAKSSGGGSAGAFDLLAISLMLLLPNVLRRNRKRK